MSRSLGDLDLKKFGVVAIPDTRMVKVKHGIDSFLVLTSDGVCSVLSDQEICDTVSSCSDPWTAAKALNDQAAAFNSSDNTTSIVVPLGSWGSTSKSTSIFYSFGRNVSCSSRFS
jgi:protein phosphatase 1K